MINTCTARFQFIPFEMNVSTAMIKEALAPPELKNLAARIASATFFPFLIIASFEAIVINGTRLLLNTCILVLNSAYTIFFPNEFVVKKVVIQAKAPPIVTAPLTVTLTQPSSQVTMPPLAREERDKLEYIVTTLATAGSVFALLGDKYLKPYGVQTKPVVHPFQFMELIFGKFSKVKQHMPNLMGRVFVPGEFIKGFLESALDPIHAAKTNLYIHSFAKKVKLTPEKVMSFGDFSQYAHWEELLKHLMGVNGLKVS